MTEARQPSHHRGSDDTLMSQMALSSLSENGLRPEVLGKSFS